MCPLPLTSSTTYELSLPVPQLQVKEVRIDAEAQRGSEAELERVRQDADAKRAALEQWCITSYGEVGQGGVFF